MKEDGMSKPLISIIVPVYNTEQYLSKCLDSLINQTYKNIEIICVNDGSTDNSADILNEYDKKDKRVRMISQKNCGLSAARNTGLKNCCGEYVMFLDSDDWIDIDTCEKAYSVMEKYDTDLVLWSYVKEYENISKDKYIFEMDSHYFDASEAKDKIFRRCVGLLKEELHDPSNADSIVTAWGKLYKAELIRNIEFVDTRIIGTEDALFNIYALYNIKSAYYINECKNHYRKNNSGSITHKYNKELYNRWQCLYDLINEFIESKKLPYVYSEALSNRIALGLVGLGVNELNQKKSWGHDIKLIKSIINTKRYKESYKQMDLKYFPLHWKIFYGCAKYNFATGIYVLLLCIRKMIGR